MKTFLKKFAQIFSIKTFWFFNCHMITITFFICWCRPVDTHTLKTPGIRSEWLVVPCIRCWIFRAYCICAFDHHEYHQHKDHHEYHQHKDASPARTKWLRLTHSQDRRAFPVYSPDDWCCSPRCGRRLLTELPGWLRARPRARTTAPATAGPPPAQHPNSYQQTKRFDWIHVKPGACTGGRCRLRDVRDNRACERTSPDAVPWSVRTRQVPRNFRRWSVWWRVSWTQRTSPPLPGPGRTAPLAEAAWWPRWDPRSGCTAHMHAHKCTSYYVRSDDDKVPPPRHNLAPTRQTHVEQEREHREQVAQSDGQHVK